MNPSMQIRMLFGFCNSVRDIGRSLIVIEKRQNVTIFLKCLGPIGPNHSHHTTKIFEHTNLPEIELWSAMVRILSWLRPKVDTTYLIVNNITILILFKLND